LFPPSQLRLPLEHILINRNTCGDIFLAKCQHQQSFGKLTLLIDKLLPLHDKKPPQLGPGKRFSPKRERICKKERPAHRATGPSAKRSALNYATWIAPVGQESSQAAQSMQSSALTTATLSTIEIAPTGHSSLHASHPMHSSELTTADI